MTRTYDSIPARDVAFLGLGVMGDPMAGHLVAAEHRVTVYNRTAAKSVAWVAKHGGKSAATPAEAARGAEIVFCCVGNDDDLRSVTLGAEGAFAGMRPGAIFVDHTTASAAVARELAAAADKLGLKFVDAPVSGGNLGAINGALTVMCGGDEAAFAEAKPLAMAFAKAMTLLGPSGSGQLAKMVNQIAIAGLVQGLSEAIAFGEKAACSGARYWACSGGSRLMGAALGMCGVPGGIMARMASACWRVTNWLEKDSMSRAALKLAA